MSKRTNSRDSSTIFFPPAQRRRKVDPSPLRQYLDSKDVPDKLVAFCAPSIEHEIISIQDPDELDAQAMVDRALQGNPLKTLLFGVSETKRARILHKLHTAKSIWNESKILCITNRDKALNKISILAPTFKKPVMN